MIFFAVVIIAAISIVWAIISLKKERNKKEIGEAKEEISKGRVVFHSSEASDSSSS